MKASLSQTLSKLNRYDYIEWSVVLLAFASGVLHPVPAYYYGSQLVVFAILVAITMGLGYLFHLFSQHNGQRIQGQRRRPAPIMKEAGESIRSMFIAACLAAWPIALYRAGYPTGYAWTLEEMGLTWWMVVLQMYGGIIAVDAYTYWKHRLLHTKTFFPFHRKHHSFHDPTPFAGFAVGPVESILTYWPILLICYPPAKHFVPLYLTAIIGFVLLNLYLHCGVTFAWMEKVIPRIGLNTSAWHNVHHSDTISNFGEVSFIWDKICKTTREDIRRKKDLKTQSA